MQINLKLGNKIIRSQLLLHRVKLKSGVMVVLTLFIYDYMPGVEDKMKEY